MKIVPLSKENHHNWSYTGLPHYLHTIKDSIVPILIAEIGRLVSTNPMVFIEEEEKIGLFSLQSLLPEMNLMINREGLWINDYIPARYRSLPFVLASDQKDKTGKEKILCYIENLNCVGQTFDKESTKIFNEKGELSENMQRVFEFLQSIEQNELATKTALSAIKKADLLQDWKLSLKLSDGEKQMTGLKIVNIKKLKALPAAILEDLNKSGGLDICFASYLSLNNLNKLKDIVISKTSEAKNKKEPQKTQSLRDLTLEKQKKAQKAEMDTLVKDLLLDE